MGHKDLFSGPPRPRNGPKLSWGWGVGRISLLAFANMEAASKGGKDSRSARRRVRLQHLGPQAAGAKAPATAKNKNRKKKEEDEKDASEQDPAAAARVPPRTAAAQQAMTPPAQAVVVPADADAQQAAQVAAGQAAVPGVPGLLYLADFVSVEEERELLATLNKQPWRADLRRRVQHYGRR